MSQKEKNKNDLLRAVTELHHSPPKNHCRRMWADMNGSRCWLDGNGDGNGDGKVVCMFAVCITMHNFYYCLSVSESWSKVWHFSDNYWNIYPPFCRGSLSS